MRTANGGKHDIFSGFGSHDNRIYLGKRNNKKKIILGGRHVLFPSMRNMLPHDFHPCFIVPPQALLY